MARQLDLNQSAQVFVDGRGPFSPEEDEISSVATGRRALNSSQVEVMVDDGVIRIEVEKDTIQQANSVGNTVTATSLKHVRTIEGTHSHIKNSLHHVCTNTPFPNFYSDSVLFIDRTDFMQQKIREIINDPEYPRVDHLLRIFLDENLEILEPLRLRFTFPTAKVLFNITPLDDFNYGCLTPFDCNLLRVNILSKFQLSKCPCSGPNCFDMSRIVAEPLQSTNTTPKSSTNYVYNLYRNSKKIQEDTLDSLKKFNKLADEFLRESKATKRLKLISDTSGVDEDDDE